ncbi:predicted protein [Postia placenta Mad-698-R]|nr:predicted protein [Postia placenta Mad-698-R]
MGVMSRCTLNLFSTSGTHPVSDQSTILKVVVEIEGHRAIPTDMLPRLPVEIWLLIIDELGAEREYDALEACAKATEGLIQERAIKYVPDEMTFRTQEEVASIELAQRWEGPRKVRIEGGRRRGERLPIPHLATFASRLARKWPRVWELTIERAEWRVQDLDLPSVLLDLASFNIVQLQLYDITFPTVLTLWRLVSFRTRLIANPHLGTLRLRDVEIIKAAFNARVLSALRLLAAPGLGRMTLPPMGLDEITTERPGSPATHSAGLLQLWDVTLPTASAFARVLFALPALNVLHILGPCAFSKHGFPTGDPLVHLGNTLQLTSITLGEDFTLHSDPQSVHDLVDIFIQYGDTDRIRLQWVSVWLSSSLRVSASTDIALNRLVAYAGQSLKGITLQVVPQDSSPAHDAASLYTAPSKAYCFDISANTHLYRLACSIDVTHEDDSPLLADFPRLERVLSQKVFGWLSSVVISFQREDILTEAGCTRHSTKPGSTSGWREVQKFLARTGSGTELIAARLLQGSLNHKTTASGVRLTEPQDYRVRCGRVECSGIRRRSKGVHDDQG